MKKLTRKKAKKISKEILSDIKDDEEREFHKIHTEAVVKAALILSKGKRVNKKILETAAWIHDIGYSLSEENHAEKSIEILKKKGFEVNEKIEDCVLNHGGGGKPESKEAKLLQIADKASTLDSGILKILIKYRKKGKFKEGDLKFIRKMSEKANDMLEKYNSL